VSHAGLADLLSYPVAACLQDRRTRRMAQGVSIAGYESANDPSPLTPLEEAILIASTGLTGTTMHDGPLDKPDGSPELGTPFLNIAGRAAASADNCQATSLFMINDEAIWLLERPREQAATELFREIPPRWEDRTEDDWLAYASAVKGKVHDGRFEFPREWPYYLGWNAQHSNAPGTTCFLPVVDQTRQYINGLLILLSEPHGKVPLFLDEWRPFRPRSAVEWVAWLAAKVGLVDPIPYQPIGGLARARGGFATPDAPLPIGAVFGDARTLPEPYFLLQNLMLMGEALRLGGWVHGTPLIPGIWHREPGRLGLGFREHLAKPAPGRWGRWPPVPASQPNFVGIDGVLEGLCPPYVTDMDSAVDQLIEEKLSGPYGAEAFGQARARTHPPEAIAYTKEICRYLVETYGRFPAHTDAFHLPGIWVQFSHLEVEYYERFAEPGFARRAAEGREIWGR
jgi:hypothetical protein